MADKIKTFDGKVWDVEELEKKAIDDSFYYGYLGQNALSSSSLKLLHKSPRAYQDSLNGIQMNSKALYEGKLIHQMLLEPDKVDDVVVIDTTTRGTRIFKEAFASNQNTFTEKEFAHCKSIADSVMRNKVSGQAIRIMQPEVPKIGLIDGLPFRGKADLLSKDGSSIIDIKTTGDLSRFRWAVRDFGYDMQCVIYCELFGISYEDFYFLVVDKKTKEVGLFDIKEETYLSGVQKVDFALDQYHKYFVNKEEDINDFTIFGKV
tara:strand:+ start:2885 stop:3670 length:786 start_codon:yes stop_codon:yes gene_type:complete